MPKTMRAALASYWAECLADSERPPMYRLVCARQLAHMALMDWNHEDRRRRKAARAAGEALLRLVEQLPLSSMQGKGCPPGGSGGQPGTPWESEGRGGAVDQLAGQRWKGYGGDD